MSMRQKANYSLLLLAILFLAAVMLQVQNGVTWWSKALIFITEAGLVGALADWFAVTALFRHPLGIKWLPHTAIVPRNREKLIDGVVYLVQEQLLSKKLVEEQLQRVKLIDIIIKFTDQQKDNANVGEFISRLLQQFIDQVQTKNIALKLENQLIDQLSGKSVATYASRGLKLVVEKRYEHFVIEKLLHIAKEKVEQPATKEFIRQLLEDEKNKMMGKNGGGWLAKALFHIAEFADAVNLDEAAEVLYKDLLQLLTDLHDPDHELRVLLREQLNILAEELEQSELMGETLAKWSEELMGQLSLTSTIQQWLDHMKAELVKTDLQSAANKWLHIWIKRLFKTFWMWFKSDEQSKQQVEQVLQHFVTHIIRTEYEVIGKIVRSTLDTFTEDKLVEFIESKVDVDLQRIRVNGAFIGAAVGAILYGFLYLVYEPILYFFQT